MEKGNRRKHSKVRLKLLKKKRKQLTKRNLKEFNLEEYQITILDDLIQEELGNKSLLFSTANLSLIRKNQILTKNTKQVIAYETIYSDTGKPISKKPVAVDVELEPNDLKTIDDGIDKNAISLELAQRHSNSQVQINN